MMPWGSLLLRLVNTWVLLPPSQKVPLISLCTELQGTFVPCGFNQGQMQTGTVHATAWSNWPVSLDVSDFRRRQADDVDERKVCKVAVSEGRNGKEMGYEMGAFYVLYNVG